MSYWFTTKQGKHVFVENGQSPMDAFIRQNKKEAYEEDTIVDKNGNEIKTEFKQSSPKEFKKLLDEARDSHSDEEKWRVDNTHTIEDYEEDTLFVTKNNSTIAITKDGDIISVCTNANSEDRGRSLIQYAVKKGGKKLDAYDGIYGFYTKNGFEPVSWTKFDKQYAPDDWVDGRDKEENVIFYKYTGKKDIMSLDEFYKKVKPSSSYDEAQKKRDDEIR